MKKYVDDTDKDISLFPNEGDMFDIEDYCMHEGLVITLDADGDYEMMSAEDMRRNMQEKNIRYWKPV